MAEIGWYIGWKNRKRKNCNERIKIIFCRDIQITTDYDRSRATQNGNETGTKFLKNKNESSVEDGTKERPHCKYSLMTEGVRYECTKKEIMRFI